MEEQKNKGITLIALVITIIVLLILAGVTIAILMGDNGIITKANVAKNTMEEEKIRERISLAVEAANIKGKGTIGSENLENELINEFGKDNYTLLVVGKNYLIIVEGVKYKINEIGNVSTGEKVTDVPIEFAGDLSKGGKYDGTTQETAYQINCIEDLVEWSKNYRKYQSSYISLERTLDFEDISSYDNYKTITTDINGNGKEEYLITELTTGIGFNPIASFSGTFDGENNQIRNLYEYVTGSGGLFEVISANIKNLGIKANIISKGNAGAIVASANSSKIENCFSEGKIEGTKNVGGLIGYGVAYAELYITNCYNKASINSDSNAGGIIGSAYPVYITNCYNEGPIESLNIAGGIIGDQNYSITIYNSYNQGYVKASEKAGGIIGRIYQSAKIKNTYNLGKIDGNKYMGAIVGTALWNNPDTSIQNSFYLRGTAKKGTNNCTDTTIVYDETKFKSEEFINELNSYINNNKELTENWLYWKKSESGYPVFDR